MNIVNTENGLDFFENCIIFIQMKHVIVISTGIFSASSLYTKVNKLNLVKKYTD